MIDKDPRQVEMPFYVLTNEMKNHKCQEHVDFCNKFLAENLPKQEMKGVKI